MNEIKPVKFFESRDFLGLSDTAWTWLAGVLCVSLVLVLLAGFIPRV